MSDQRGSTLLELLIVIAILGLVSSAAVLAAPTLMAQAQARQFEARLDALIVSARDAAVRGGSPVVMQFSADGRRISAPSLRATLEVPPTASLTLDGVANETGRGARNGTAAILFLADGSSTGGVISVRFSERSFTRRISWLTGRVDAGR